MKSPSEPPRCFNRAPYLPGYWRVGLCEDGSVVKTWVSSRWSQDRCVTHEGRGIGKNGESYPEAHGWMPWCLQCRWMPAKDRT